MQQGTLCLVFLLPWTNLVVVVSGVGGGDVVTGVYLGARMLMQIPSHHFKTFLVQLQSRTPY